MLEKFEGIPGRENYIIGIDPGVTTGLSIIGWDGEKPPLPHEVDCWASDQISYGGSGNVKDLYSTEGGFVEQEICRQIQLFIMDAYSWCDNLYIAIEDFVIRRVDTSRDFLSPVRLTAGILQAIYPILTDLDSDGERANIVFQSPSDAKGVCTDARMDSWGYEIKTQKDRHSRDADRHAVLLLRRMIENPRLFKGK